MFVFRVDVLLAEMGKYAPEVIGSVRESVAARTGDLVCERLGKEEFASAPDISIVYALAERSSRVAVVPAGVNTGSVRARVAWDSLRETLAKGACPSPRTE